MKTTTRIHLHARKETLYVTCSFGEIESNPYFSCTGVLVSGIRKNETEKGIPDKAWLMAGCLHDEILKVSKDFADIISLHLSDENGVPMYASENGYYYYSQGQIDVLADHLRISREDAQKLASNLDGIKEYELKMAMFLTFVSAQKERWKREAENILSKYFPSANH